MGDVVDVRLVEVDSDNWRACAALRPHDGQRRWVADITYYLCLCAYGDTWHPLAIEAGDDIVGFLMWGVDDDASRWIGGLVIDAAHQRRGIARAAVVQVVRLLDRPRRLHGGGAELRPRQRGGSVSLRRAGVHPDRRDR